MRLFTNLTPHKIYPTKNFYSLKKTDPKYIPSKKFLRFHSTREEVLKQQFENLKKNPKNGNSEIPEAIKKPDQNKKFEKPKIRGIKHMVAVSSAKGGVGKSTVAVNLALSFERMGLKTGILDTDIYGPSIPIMMNLKAHRATANEFQYIVPLRNYNVSCMSVGFLIPEDKPIIWRGPIVMGALNQMLKQVEWGELDVLVVDLPPGTGDTQLTLAQTAPLSGAVIVSTPQDLALADAIRGTNMFKTVEVPIFGLVENMSYYHCPKCGNEDHIFGDSGAPRVAKELGIDFLGKIPLHTSIRETTDSGKPIVASDPQSPLSMAYIDIAKKVLHCLIQQDKSGQSQPNIIFE